ncbi:MAG TPA: hypothetical protein VG963_22675 [Polyangiaceae bacterium]|nr:hypothetical protein [Polyangiaceae bacterium]
MLHTARPTLALRFDRTPDDPRSRRWQAEPGLELVHEDGMDLVRRKDRAPFQTASLAVPARYIAQAKEYPPFFPYSDGGLLIYTGQFHSCPAPSGCGSDERWQIEVTPPRGSHLLVDGVLHESVCTFGDTGDGTNIYIGRSKPLSTSHFVAVIDQGLPPQVVGALNRLLPPMMDFFTTRLGRLPFQPMLFAALDPNPPQGSGFSMQGSALPGQIAFHLYGEKWAKAAPDELLDRLPWMFAHEAAHLFQSLDLAGDSYPEAQSWIHEGGAEAFAALAIAAFGGLSPEHVQGHIDGERSECAAGLRALAGKPLNASAEAHAWRNYYTCGLVMQLAIDVEAKRSSAGARGLFDVWARFLSRVHAAEPFNQDTFLQAATDLGAAQAATFARTLATVPQGDPLQFL